ncbi:hypothetical protein GCM10007096_29950 [Pullulanibacillus pueri]|uniref:Uncharacterized protein n=1 Tax=Pullulanibacillus pueri TaxID=1437324 RepID=A0A8J2ZYF8_9BACL|nr:hypothetical protein GCM10007096_29950 [Pullulanibacillus pueri]
MNLRPPRPERSLRMYKPSQVNLTLLYTLILALATRTHDSFSWALSFNDRRYFAFNVRDTMR